MLMYIYIAVLVCPLITGISVTLTDGHRAHKIKYKIIHQPGNSVSHRAGRDKHTTEIQADDANITISVSEQAAVISAQLKCDNSKVEAVSTYILAKLQDIRNACSTSKFRIYDASWRDCSDVYSSGFITSGVYAINVRNQGQPLDVYCDASYGGGWTVLQRRVDGMTPFNRSWEEYAKGFGNLNKEFWLGNDNIYALTSNAEVSYTLMITLLNSKQEERFAVYTDFRIDPASDNYMLHIGSFSGNAGDAMSNNNNMQFSTTDRDNDAMDDDHCSVLHGGSGWWHKWCTYANLNGRFTKQQHVDTYDYMYWYQWQGYYKPLTYIQMMIRPTNFQK